MRATPCNAIAALERSSGRAGCRTVRSENSGVAGLNPAALPHVAVVGTRRSAGTASDPSGVRPLGSTGDSLALGEEEVSRFRPATVVRLLPFFHLLLDEGGIDERENRLADVRRETRPRLDDALNGRRKAAQFGDRRCQRVRFSA
jgi:hypothetical protein